ncbi:MAG: hypothetical protein KDB14_19820 [Planctomycetales bacterium]|nr:hypothetical protein [Planctomycetales bacterium]
MARAIGQALCRINDRIDDYIDDCIDDCLNAGLDDRFDRVASRRSTDHQPTRLR